MTQRDRFSKRPSVMKYWAYKAALRDLCVELPIPYKVTFFLAMPKSWSKKKRAQHVGMPHLQTPDKDNLEKGFLDALFDDDSHVWSGWTEKRWAETAHITVERMPPTMQDIARKHGAR